MEHPNIAAIRRELEADDPPRKWDELTNGERRRIREHWGMNAVLSGRGTSTVIPAPVEVASGRAATRRRAQAARAAAKAGRS